MKACHKPSISNLVEIKYVEKQVELVNEWKLLSVTIDQHLDWKSHIIKVAKECYATLPLLKKLKR